MVNDRSRSNVEFGRRAFLKRSAAALCAPALVPARLLGGRGVVAPSDRIGLACIGVGSMGSGHLRSFLGYEDVRIVAVCDVREEHRLRARERVDRRYGDGACATYSDYRELLERPDIDAVCIAVPDHWHVLIGLEAARRGVDMYYEKPLGMSVAEDIAMREAVNRYGVVFHFGTQQRSDDRFRLACELVRNGRIGELRTVMIGSANYKQIPMPPPQPVPPGFDYDMWLGPAPWAPYTFERCTRQWTLIRDYSLGCVSGAWGIHHVDIAQWAIGADGTGPIEVEGSGTFPEQGLYDTAIAWEVEHRYANGVRLIHMDMPTALTRAPQFKLHWMGILFLGSEGWVYVCREMIATQPESLVKTSFGEGDLLLPRSRDHHRTFLDAVRSRRQTLCPIETAVRSDSVCQQADIAMRLGRRLFWDPSAERFVDDAGANRLLSRPMRAPWHV